jgi:hypothetical protein
MVHYEKNTMIKKCKKHRINFNNLIEKFGEKKTSLILNFIFNERAPEDLKKSLPKKMFADDESNQKWDDFKDTLKECGIKVLSYFEYFIDENTGDTVPVEITYFKIFGDKKPTI